MGSPAGAISGCGIRRGWDFRIGQTLAGVADGSRGLAEPLGPPGIGESGGADRNDLGVGKPVQYSTD